MIHDEDIIDTTDPSFVQNFQGFINPPQGTSNEETGAMSVPYYLAEFIGVGEGCDYTIGCNRMNKLIEANSLERAVQGLTQWVEREYSGFTGLYEAYGKCKITIYEINASIPLDMDAYMRHEKVQSETEAKLRQEAEEREMYKRLKRKYGDV